MNTDTFRFLCLDPWQEIPPIISDFEKAGFRAAYDDDSEEIIIRTPNPEKLADIAKAWQLAPVVPL